VLGACAFNEKARELESGEGVFTHYLIRALQGEAPADRDGAITVSSVFGYVRERVQEWAAEHDAIQTPSLETSQVGDIPIIIRPHKGQEAERLAGTLSGLMLTGAATFYGEADELASDSALHDSLAGIRAKLIPTWPRSAQTRHEKEGQIRVGLNDGYVSLEWSEGEPEQWGRYPDDLRRTAVVRCAIVRPGPDAPERLASMAVAVHEAQVEAEDPRLFVFWSGDLDEDLLDGAVISAGYSHDKLYDDARSRLKALRDDGFSVETLWVSKRKDGDWCAALSSDGNYTAESWPIAEHARTLCSIFAAASGATTGE
jgi:hypothetical protein